MSALTVRIRLAVARDLAAIEEVEQSAEQAFLATLEHADAPEGPPTRPGAYLRFLSEGTAWVAEFGDALVGSLIAEAVPDALHLWELAVRLPFQRRGVGRRLVQTALIEAVARRLPAVTLTTFHGVVFNAPFYSTFGFAVLDQPPERLAAILDAEAAAGLRDRCAMRLTF